MTDHIPGINSFRIIRPTSQKYSGTYKSPKKLWEPLSNGKRQGGHRCHPDRLEAIADGYKYNLEIMRRLDSAERKS